MGLDNQGLSVDFLVEARSFSHFHSDSVAH